MAVVKKGSKVKVFYRGLLKDGTVFESNFGKDPLQFVVGKGKVIKGFEKAVTGMQLGQTKTVTFKPNEAYGNSDPELLTTVARQDLPQRFKGEVGEEVSLTMPDGSPFEGEITAIEGDQITVDGNHPLAGQSLTFEIKLASFK